MKIIDERSTTQVRFDCIPYGTVFLTERRGKDPLMKIEAGGIDYIVELSTGDVFFADMLFSPDTMVTTVEVTLVIK